MARKTPQETEKTRRLLIEKAGEMFYEKGVARTTLNDVAKAANMTRGAIYWHFENKAELFSEFAANAVYPTEQAIEQALDDDRLDALHKLRKILTLTLEIPAKDPAIRKAYTVMAHRCEYTEELQPGLSDLEEKENEFVSVIQQLIEEAQQAGRVTLERPSESLTFAAYAYIDGILNRWTYGVNTPKWDLANEAQALIDLFLNGIELKTA